MVQFAKKLHFNADARERLVRGINTACNAVVQTLGPKAANVAIAQAYGSPRILHDGTSIANEVNLQDPFENMGAQLVKEACAKTVSRAGDGTTLTACLTQVLVNEGNKLIASGYNAQTLKSEIEKELKVVLEKLEKLSRKVTTNEEVKQVASVSSANPQIGEMIAQAYDKVGTDGIVTSEIGNELRRFVRSQDHDFESCQSLCGKGI